MPATIDTEPDRSCEGCTLCCFLPSVEEFSKPRMTWCPECKVGVGCGIYETRPKICRTFRCRYLYDSSLGEVWKPSTSHFLITYEADANRIAIHVDPEYPSAWKMEPYYSQIKEWAHIAIESLGQVLVWEGDQIVAVLPDREKRLGKVGEDKYILTTQKRSIVGQKLDVVVVDANDPLVAELPGGEHERFA